MNGTSMSSPNACGCITLLLSAALATNTKYSTTSIRQAVERSALFIPNIHPLGQGYGLVQVSAAWSLFTDMIASSKYTDVGYKIRVNHLNFQNGIYLRQPHESATATTYSISIEPDFPGITVPLPFLYYTHLLCHIIHTIHIYNTFHIPTLTYVYYIYIIYYTRIDDLGSYM